MENILMIKSVGEAGELQLAAVEEEAKKEILPSLVSPWKMVTGVNFFQHKRKPVEEE